MKKIFIFLLGKILLLGCLGFSQELVNNKIERKAAGCVERCLDQCGQGGNDTYSMEYINMCEAP